jgi:hypothetical protein
LKSINNPAYKNLITGLINARCAAKISQATLSGRMARHQSYVSKVETHERRLDVVEYVEWVRALEMDPTPLIASVADDLASTRPRRTLVKG